MRAARQPLQGLLILLAALLVSPLGYLLIGPLGALTDRAAGSPVLSRIRIVERTGSTNADLLADRSCRRRRLAGRARAGGGQGAAGPRLGLGGGQFLRQHVGSSCARTIRRAQTLVAGRGAGAGRGDRRRGARPAADAQMAQRLDAARQEARRHPARAQRRPGRGRLRGQPRRRARASGPCRGRRSAARSRRRPSRRCSPASFARLLGLWRQQRAGALARAWLARAHPVGTQLTVHAGTDETVTGRFDGLEPDGALRLRRDDGSLEVVRAGDVEL